MPAEINSAIEIVTVPCLADNYAFLIHNSDTGQTALVDIPDAAPIQAELDRRGWQLSDILITHHHWDHIDGLPNLEQSARIIGAKPDAHRLPTLDLAVADGDRIDICGQETEIFETPGHTVGHICFYLPGCHAVFTADTLMAMGCGRLFEGTPAQMHASLNRLAALPGETVVYSGHEYMPGNMGFAQSIEASNPALTQRAKDAAAARAAGIPTVPSLLALEKATNPFLRAHLPEMKSALGLAGASDLEAFTALRAAKDRF